MTEGEVFESRMRSATYAIEKAQVAFKLLGERLAEVEVELAAAKAVAVLAQAAEEPAEAVEVEQPTPKPQVKALRKGAWTPDEEQIVIATYPTIGAVGAVKALSRSGYTRGHIAVVAKAKLLQRAGLMGKARSGRKPAELESLVLDGLVAAPGTAPRRSPPIPPTPAPTATGASSASEVLTILRTAPHPLTGSEITQRLLGNTPENDWRRTTTNKRVLAALGALVTAQKALVIWPERAGEPAKYQVRS